MRRREVVRHESSYPTWKRVFVARESFKRLNAASFHPSDLAASEVLQVVFVWAPLAVAQELATALAFATELVFGYGLGRGQNIAHTFAVHAVGRDGVLIVPDGGQLSAPRVDEPV